MRTSFFFAVTSLASMLALAAACSSSTTTVVSGDAGEDEADATTTKDAGKDSSTKDAGGGGQDAAPTGDEACAAESTANACQTCCITNHQQGANDMINGMLACACKGTGATDSKPACATECADSYCAADPKDPQDGDACSNCVDTALDDTKGTCYQAFIDACKASDDCMAMQTECFANCPK